MFQSHWPSGWTPGYVTEYLSLLAKLSTILLENDQTKLGKKSILRKFRQNYIKMPESSSVAEFSKFKLEFSVSNFRMLDSVT